MYLSAHDLHVSECEVMIDANASKKFQKFTVRYVLCYH